MILTKDKKILIVGLGLIGGSYAMGLSKKGYEVGAISLNQDDIDYAISNNIIKHGQVKVSKEYVSSFDIIIFALYPKILLDWIRKYNSYFKSYAYKDCNRNTTKPCVRQHTAAGTSGTYAHNISHSEKCFPRAPSEFLQEF